MVNRYSFSHDSNPMNKNFIAGLNESGYKGIVTHYIFDYQEFWYIDKIKKIFILPRELLLREEVRCSDKGCCAEIYLKYNACKSLRVLRKKPFLSTTSLFSHKV